MTWPVTGASWSCWTMLNQGLLRSLDMFKQFKRGNNGDFTCAKIGKIVISMDWREIQEKNMAFYHIKMIGRSPEFSDRFSHHPMKGLLCSTHPKKCAIWVVLKSDFSRKHLTVFAPTKNHHLGVQWQHVFRISWTWVPHFSPSSPRRGLQKSQPSIWPSDLNPSEPTIIPEIRPFLASFPIK